jgi:hypothetical protein
VKHRRTFIRIAVVVAFAVAARFANGTAAMAQQGSGRSAVVPFVP